MADGEDDYWGIPVLSAALLQPRTIVFRAATGRVVMIPPPDDGVIVPDAQIRIICAAARTALSVARHQRRRL